MSETTTKGDIEIIDILDSPSASKNVTPDKPAKKLKQLRLPFAPIQKNAAAAGDKKDDEGTAKKRKHSEEEEAGSNKKLQTGATKKFKENQSEPQKIDNDCEIVKTDDSVVTKKEDLDTVDESSGVKVDESNGEKDEESSGVKDEESNDVKVDESNGAKDEESSGAKDEESKVIELDDSDMKVDESDKMDSSDIKLADEGEIASSEMKTPSTKSALPRSIGATPTSSPAVIEEYRRKLRVEIAKVTVQLTELKISLEKAVDEQEFLKAQELKEKIKLAELEKETMSASLDSSDLNELKRFLTPKTASVTSSVSSTPTSAMTTPTNRKRQAQKVRTPGSGPVPDSGTPKVKKLTPKQVALRAEIEKRKEEKERQREEVKKAKEAERLKKEEERKEKEAEKERERLEKELLKKQKEEEKEQQRLERERQKEAEKREKEEKQKQREAEKKDREEKQKQRELERKQQEELEKKKVQKVSQTFINFFVKKENNKQDTETEEVSFNPNNLTQFRVKKDMRVAPSSRVCLDDTQMKELDLVLTSGVTKTLDSLYLSELKTSKRQIQKSQRTWPYEVVSESSKKCDDDEVEILEEDDDEDDEEIGDVVAVQVDLPEKADQVKQTIRAKLLQFHDNQRPPYFGTWSKQSPLVGPRHPFGKDQHFFDYDYDSDEDWEEEEQGESLSDEEKDKEEDEEEQEEKGEDNDDDDGFFVGHGVLGKDELHAGDDSDEGEFDAELEMKKQKLRAQEFEKEYKKKKTMKLKPRLYGPLWVKDPKEERPAIVLEQLYKIFSSFKAVSLCPPGGIPTTISHPAASPSGVNGASGDNGETPSVNGNGQPGNGTSRKLRTFPDESLPDLIRLIHANTNNKNFLAKEFAEFWKKQTGKDVAEGSGSEIPRSKIVQKIQEIADYQKCPEIGPMFNKRCWIVKQDIITKFSIEKLEIPNNWEYILEVPTRVSASGTPIANPLGPNSSETGIEPGCETPKSDRGTPSASAPGSCKGKIVAPSSLITKFTKVLSEEERLNQLQAMKPAATSAVEDPVAIPIKVKRKIQPTLIDMARNKTAPANTD